MKELISVVMPTHNGDRFLEDSIRSILAQTYANLELLITDDCSDNNATWKYYNAIKSWIHAWM